MKRFNFWSFIGCIILLALSIQAIYATSQQTWQWAPNAFTLWVLSVIVCIGCIIGFGDKSRALAKWRSWVTMLLIIPLSLAFLFGVATNIFAKEHIDTTQSPNGETTIDFYTLNGGAATSISVVGYLNGPLWLKKQVFYEEPMHEVNVEWLDNETVIINQQTLHFEKGD